MKNLTAQKIKGETVLINEDGKTVAIYPAHLTQPKKSQKTMIHNCFRYNLIWKD